MSFLSDAVAAGEDWPGTFDLCRGPKGWFLNHHTCTNSTCWCADDPPEGRCGFTAERAREELAGALRETGDYVEANRIERLPLDAMIAEHFAGD